MAANDLGETSLETNHLGTAFAAGRFALSPFDRLRAA